MPWTSLYLTDWEAMLPLMKRLGIKGGHEKWTRRSGIEPAVAAGMIAHDGVMLSESQWITEEWGAEGLRGVHLNWDFNAHSIEDLALMMSVDSIAYEGLAKAQKQHVEANYVIGQKRKVFLVCPNATVTDLWAAIESVVEYNDGACELHYTNRLQAHQNGRQFVKMFGGMFDAVSYSSTRNLLCLPNGRTIEPENAYKRPGTQEWVEMVGCDFDEVAMEGPLGGRGRKILSVASAFWASRNWDATLPTLMKPPEDQEWAKQVALMGATPDLLVENKKVRVAIKGSHTPELGDMIACSACSLADVCRLAREGSICTIPESDMGELAEFFKTRDANRVIEGLGHLLGKQADRVEQAMAAEDMALPEEAAALRADVTKMVHGLFDRGAKLAMLNDPRLKGSGPQVSVSLTQNAVGAIASGSPQQLAAGVVAELEARGVRREDITPELIAHELGAGAEDVVDAVVVPADPIVGNLPESP